MQRPNFTRLRHFFGWTRDSSILLGAFFFTIGLIIYVWWPLAEEILAYVDWQGEWWRYFDWLLVGIFLFMSIAIVSHANLARDSLTIFVAAFGGLVIESWGTQTNLWHYYTAERPPLWIIPAWPIATLTINRIVLVLGILFKKQSQPLSGDVAERNRSRRAALREHRPSTTLLPLVVAPLRNWTLLKTVYWTLFTAFFILMLTFTAPTFDKSYTLLAILLVFLLIITPTNHRLAILIFIAGAGLGYFLELWGTTRECWTYYTLRKPPFFAILAHGMAAVAFWRTELLITKIWQQFTPLRKKKTNENQTQ